jgi:hypothetical protein
MPRRRLLTASAAALPLLLATTGCHSADLFAGPDPLGGRPPLAPGTVVLEAVIAAETRLISRYKSVMSGASAAPSGHQASVLEPLLAHHEQHLAQLRGMLVVPLGAQAPESPSGTAAPSPAASAAGPDSIAQLRAAERESAATLVRQLGAVEPALAQLFASIAASDATHATALAAL